MPSGKAKSDYSVNLLFFPAKKYFLAGFIFSGLVLFTLSGSSLAQITEIRPKPLLQSGNLYDDDLLPASFHVSRRKLFRDAMADRSAAVFIAAPVRNRSNDVNYEYHQNPDFYYYTGYRHPNALLVIFKSPQNINGITSDEFIFIPESNKEIETWTGKLPSAEEVKKSSGIHAVLLNTGFDKIEFDWNEFEKIYLKQPQDINLSSQERGSTGWLTARFKEKTAAVSSKIDKASMAKINAELREVKTPEEIELLRKAVTLTCRGFIEALKAAQPGMTEYQLQSINEHFWYYGGAEYAGYPSIVGGGHNSCVLHYETNRKKLKDGDILVMDMGAEYHGYTADITRSFPINGKFSPEQKIIYELVLKAQEAGIAACKSGAGFNEPHRIATKIIAEGLVKLGLIKTEEEVRQYFMHGTSHYLGLDVHDPGTYGPLKPNSVITVEPGIYIKEGSPCDPKWWNIGIRIEDDILITDNEPVNLSACVPKSIPEIEALMAQDSPFNRIHDH